MNDRYIHRLAARCVLVAVSIAPVTGALNAQEGFDPMSAGRHYVLTFPDTARNARDVRFNFPKYEEKWLAFVYSAVDTRLRVSAPGISRAPITIIGGRTTVIDFRSPDFMMPQTMTTEPVCRPMRATTRLEADDPIIVHCFMSTSYGAEAWTPLPVEAWGTEYYAATYPGEIINDFVPAGMEGSLTKRAAPAEIVVVAAYDGTRVTVASGGRLAAGCSGTDILLNAGESTVIESHVDTGATEGQAALGGTRILATRPIGVLSGNTRAQILPEVNSLTGNATRNLLIEWLSPIEYHGTTFVYMPTWDSRRPTGAPDEKLEEKRTVEMVGTFGTHAELTTGAISCASGPAIPYDHPIHLGDALQSRQIATEAVVHTTSAPSQVMMGSVPISVLRATQQVPWAWGGKFDSWAGYMVELVPRERWTAFAPVFAPAAPAGLEHYVNLAVDTAHRNDVYLADGRRFSFSRRIAGTDLIWGSMALQPGQSMWVSGRNGARFGGFVYGTFTAGGREEFRPGRAKDPVDPPAGIAPPSGSRDASSSDSDYTLLLHPSEYEEWIGIAYGYPIATPHIVIGVSDTVKVDLTDHGCGAVEMRFSVVNERASGLHGVSLEGAINASIREISPQVLTGELAASLTIVPIDGTKDATARIVAISRTGQRTIVPYSYTAPHATLGTGASATFGTLTTREQATRDYPFTNMGTVAVRVDSIWIGPSDAFSVATDSPFPVTLQPGESIGITVSTNTESVHGLIVDTLQIELECATVVHQISIQVIAPAIAVSDVDMGSVTAGTRTSGTVVLQNTSQDTLTLHASPASVVQWEDPLFTIANQTLEALAGRALEPGRSVEIPIAFAGAPPGAYAVVAHIRSNAVSGNSTSTWRVSVSDIPGGIAETRSALFWFTALPIPADDILSLTYSLPEAGRARCEVFDGTGTNRMVVLLGAGQRTGRLDVDVEQLPPGVYLLRLIVGSEVRSQVTMVAR